MGELGKVTGLRVYQRSCGAMDNASDYESEDYRFESCQNRNLLFLGQKCIRVQVKGRYRQGDRLGPVSEVLWRNGQRV
jgi:hypothetical protein